MRRLGRGGAGPVGRRHAPLIGERGITKIVLPLTVSRTIAASPQSVWRVLTDLDAWPAWGPSVRRAELDGPLPLRLGARGGVWTPIGVRLPFEITEFDEGSAWAWRVAGVPATRHAVRPHGDGCVATFGVPIWAPLYLTVCAVALRRIEALATG